MKTDQPGEHDRYHIQRLDFSQIVAFAKRGMMMTIDEIYAEIVPQKWRNVVNRQRFDAELAALVASEEIVIIDDEVRLKSNVFELPNGMRMSGKLIATTRPFPGDETVIVSFLAAEMPGAYRDTIAHRGFLGADAVTPMFAKYEQTLMYLLISRAHDKATPERLNLINEIVCNIVWPNPGLPRA